MSTLFDLVMIGAGLILGVSVFGKLQRVGDSLEDASTWLNRYRTLLGSACLIFALLLAFRPGHLLSEIVGILAGLLLLGSRLAEVPGVGDDLARASRNLVPFEAIIGVAAVIMGLLGILG